MRRTVFLSTLLLFLLGAAPAARAQETWELGVRFDVLNAGGEPSNDQLGYGATLRYHLNESWRLGFAVDSISGDFERPYTFVGLGSPEEIDSTIDALIWSAWIEREAGAPERRLRWYWTLGLGYASPDIEDITGPVTGGGTFDITTDAGSELLVSAGGGFRIRLGRGWRSEVGVRVDQHFADWTITDRVSGRTGAIDDYTTVGLLFGFNYRF